MCSIIKTPVFPFQTIEVKIHCALYTPRLLAILAECNLNYKVVIVGAGLLKDYIAFKHVECGYHKRPTVLSVNSISDPRIYQGDH